MPSLGYFTPAILKVNIFPLNHSTVRITLYFGMLWKIIHSKVLGLKFPPFHLNPIKFWERERERNVSIWFPQTFANFVCCQKSCAIFFQFWFSGFVPLSSHFYEIGREWVHLVNRLILLFLGKILTVVFTLFKKRRKYLLDLSYTIIAKISNCFRYVRKDFQ